VTKLLLLLKLKQPVLDADRQLEGKHVLLSQQHQVLKGSHLLAQQQLNVLFRNAYLVEFHS
jgi:hypothetical protein